MKNWVRLATVAIVILAVLLGFRALSVWIEWCPPERCLSLIGADFLGLLKFEWVGQYQTLLGGLALGAGAFVLSAAKLEIQAADRRERNRERALIVDALLQISTCFHRCYANLERQKTEGLKYAETAEAFIPQATRSSATLGYLIPASIDLIKQKLVDDPLSESQVKLAAIVAFASATIFLESAMAIKKSEDAIITIRGGNMKFDDTRVRKMASKLEVDYDTISFLGRYFSKPKLPK
ncbi:hypothetical protein J2X72_003911 [Phyllobacterium sp. 1468]|uniref:hypothetical protein n=1 Tax=Phyllobacterium sp. 1468 TaxID=2817759 RepID=UPI00285B5788|nr:hypothetical protein [Phyllobacterium sp. 1468]MDR6635099.1 hypothetical protein [Phyllobacterium sp. 1468]